MHYLKNRLILTLSSPFSEGKAKNSSMISTHLRVVAYVRGF